MRDPKDQPLSCDIVDGQLVIRIGVATLKHAAEHCPLMYGVGDKSYPPYVTVVDQEQLAKDVRGELLREKEDGETALHRLLDQAFLDALEQGSIAFEGEGDGEE